MDLAERLRAVLEARTQAGQGEARAQLGEAKDALAGRRDVLELLHQWITCARGGRSVLAGSNLVSAEEYFPHQVQREWVPVHRCAVCVMEEDAAS